MKAIAFILALASCCALACRAEDNTPQLQEDILPQTTNGNFVLYVSNQSSSMSPVDITIHVDGKKAVSSEFAVGNSHQWVKHTFQLPPGKHKLVAVSKKGSATMEKEFDIKDKHWAVVDYWFSNSNQEGKKFSFMVRDTPIAFM